jgi:hypothetical protein
MTPIYDALRATALPSTPEHATDVVSGPRSDLRLVPSAAPAPDATLRPPAPAVPTPFPVRVLSTPRTPPWRAGLLP